MDLFEQDLCNYLYNIGYRNRSSLMFINSLYIFLSNRAYEYSKEGLQYKDL